MIFLRPGKGKVYFDMDSGLSGDRHPEMLLVYMNCANDHSGEPEDEMFAGRLQEAMDMILREEAPLKDKRICTGGRWVIWQ